MDAEEFKKAFEADRAAGLHNKKQQETEAAEDAYYDALGAEVDANGIGRGGSGRFGRHAKHMANQKE